MAFTMTALLDMSRRVSTVDPVAGDTGLVIDPCADCGHSIMDHWTPGNHPCTVEDCLCPRYRSDVFS